MHSTGQKITDSVFIYNALTLLHYTPAIQYIQQHNPLRYCNDTPTNCPMNGAITPPILAKNDPEPTATLRTEVGYSSAVIT